MQNGGLHANEVLGQALINRNLDHITLVSRKSWERTEIRASVEEVAIERAHTKAGRCTDTENSFKPNLRRKIVAELRCKLDCIFASASIPTWVKVCLSTGVSRQV